MYTGLHPFYDQTPITFMPTSSTPHVFTWTPHITQGGVWTECCMPERKSTTNSQITTLQIDLLVEGKPLSDSAFQLIEINDRKISVGQTLPLPTQAILELNDDQTITYDPGDQFHDLPNGHTAFDSFTYTVSDDNNDRIVSQVFVTIENTQGLFLLEDSFVMTKTNSPVTFPSLVNLAEVDPQDISIEVLNEPPGKTTVHADGTITFLPDTDYLGTVTLHYLVEDVIGEISDASVTIDVIP